MKAFDETKPDRSMYTPIGGAWWLSPDGYIGRIHRDVEWTPASSLDDERFRYRVLWYYTVAARANHDPGDEDSVR